MFFVSLSRSPWEPDWERRSDPARSIRFKVPVTQKSNAWMVQNTDTFLCMGIIYVDE